MKTAGPTLLGAAMSRALREGPSVLCGLSVSTRKPRVPHCEERPGAAHSSNDQALRYFLGPADAGEEPVLSSTSTIKSTRGGPLTVSIVHTAREMSCTSSATGVLYFTARSSTVPDEHRRHCHCWCQSPPSPLPSCSIVLFIMSRIAVWVQNFWNGKHIHLVYSCYSESTDSHEEILFLSVFFFNLFFRLCSVEVALVQKCSKHWRNHIV